MEIPPQDTPQGDPPATTATAELLETSSARGRRSSTADQLGNEKSTSINTGSKRFGDVVFHNAARGSGILVLVIMAAIASFLIYRSWSAITADHTNFLTTFAWSPDDTPSTFGVAVLVYGTIVSSLIALVIALPVSVGIALFISHYAPRRVAQAFGYTVDLLAAVPSIIFGIWGYMFLVPQMGGINAWLNTYLGWTYIFKQQYPGSAARSLFTVGILLAIMILPIITAVSREIFRQVPRMHEEAALALGATRWEVIRMSVLPFGRAGVISAAILGLGRALGETMAVALVLSTSSALSLHITDYGGGTLAANIANSFAEASPFGVNALIASGLVLFVITLIVNGAARIIIQRRKEYSGANA